jgi:flagellar protein FliS
MKTNSAVSAYAKVSFESEVLGASPHRLIAMLFEGALKEIAVAKKGIHNRQIAVKGEAIGRAISIIGEGLNGSLNMEAGGELAQRLRQLYEYSIIQLGKANMNNDVKLLDEVSRILGELKAGWDGIRPAGG